MLGMKMKRVLLCGVSVLAMQVSYAQAQSSTSSEPFQPRVEAIGKLGTDRSLGQMEAWMPLAQDKDSVLYTDVRFMVDDLDNNEGNIGIGYRVMRGDHIVGTHGWIDRRRTEKGSVFYQLALGAEFMKEDWDLKANVYAPLSNPNVVAVTPSAGGAPVFTGTGVYVDTLGVTVEEPQPGIDAEVGYRLPVAEQHIDSFRVYGGFYAFKGQESDDVVGGRMRASVDINPLLNVGASFQYDEPRGGQAFLEAKLRFPFSAKKRFQTDRLRARMDESPERDIDIVTGTIQDDGRNKQILNAQTGQEQRILHVDNTAANGGDGSAENPFNTLAQAQAALRNNDTLYIHRGDGTTTGQDQGIVIDKANVSLIGSGTDFVYDHTRHSVSGYKEQQLSSGTLLASASAAPVITNNTTYIPQDHLTGTGIVVTGDNTYISGISIQDVQRHGIYVFSNDQQVMNSLTISDVFLDQNINNGSYGIYMTAHGGIINNIDITGVTAIDRVGISSLIALSADQNGSIQNVNLSDANLTSTGTSRGILVVSGLTDNGHISHVAINNTIMNNVSDGIRVDARNDGVIDQITITENDITQASQYGISTVNSHRSVISNIIVNDNTISNSLYGLGFRSEANANGATASSLQAYQNLVQNSTRDGILIFYRGVMDDVSVSLSGNTATGNGLSNNYYGIRIDNDNTGTGPYHVDLGGGILGSTGENRIYGNTGGRDIYIDSRPGTAVATHGTIISAQHNWWGVNTGLDPARIVFDNGTAGVNGSRIDATNHLTVDPGI
jgi:hypothetical protein